MNSQNSILRRGGQKKALSVSTIPNGNESIRPDSSTERKPSRRVRSSLVIKLGLACILGIHLWRILLKATDEDVTEDRRKKERVFVEQMATLRTDVLASDRAYDTDQIVKTKPFAKGVRLPANKDPILKEQLRLHDEFQALLYRNQFQKGDCHQRRIMTTGTHLLDGFALELHYLSRLLQIALATDRTLVVSDKFLSGYAPSQCAVVQDDEDGQLGRLNCIYQPISNCPASNSDLIESKHADVKYMGGRMANFGIIENFKEINDEINSKGKTTESSKNSLWMFIRKLVSTVRPEKYREFIKPRFMSPHLYGSKRVVEFQQQGGRDMTGKLVDHLPFWDRHMGRYWVRSQTAHFLWDKIGLADEIREAALARIPKQLLSGEVPFIGMHIRFTDNVRSLSKDFGRIGGMTRSLHHYMKIANGIRERTGIRTIFLATDWERAVQQLSEVDKDFTFLVQEGVQRSNGQEWVWFRNMRSSLTPSIAADLEALRRADHLIGSFQSNVYRAASELNTAYHTGKYSLYEPRHHTVDLEWFEDP